MNELNELEKKVDLILDLFLKQTSSLTTYKNVAEYLDLSTRTVRNYISKEIFIENKHFYINHNNKTVFIPKAIITFKESSNVTKIRMNKETKKVTPKVIHPTASKILKSISV